MRVEIIHDEKDLDSDRNVNAHRVMVLGALTAFSVMFHGSLTVVYVGIGIVVVSFFLFRKPKVPWGYFILGNERLSYSYNKETLHVEFNQIEQMTLFYGGYAGQIKIWPRKAEGGGRNFIFLKTADGTKKLFRIMIPTRPAYLALLQRKEQYTFPFEIKVTPEHDAEVWTVLS